MAADLTFEQTIQAPVDQVYRAFTNATALREWLCDTATSDARPQGRIFLAWNSGYFTTGLFTFVEVNAGLDFSWQGCGDPAATRVHVRMSAAGASTTRLSLLHSGFQEGESWQSAQKEIEHGWKKGLQNLVSVLETGPDLRIVDKAMLGLVVGDFTPQKAAQLGVPVTKGVRLDSVLDGMGAGLAGLLKDDVIVALDGSPVANFPDLGQLLAQRKVGDRVAVQFYRGPEKLQATMEMTRRPVPEIPATPANLSAAVAKNYAGLDQALEAILAGLSPEQETFRPTPQDWNIKEILAHLIHSERDIHSWMNDIISSQERLADGYAESLAARVRATAGVFAGAADMLTELLRCEAETLAFLADLPPEFRARKGSYWKLGYHMLQPPYHIHDHLDQIRANLAAFRKD